MKSLPIILALLALMQPGAGNGAAAQAAGEHALPAATQPSPAAIVFLGIWDRSAPLVDRAVRESGVAAVTLHDTDLLARPDALRGVDVLLILNVRPETLPSLKQCLSDAKHANANLRIIPLDQRSAHAALASARLLNVDPHVVEYWQPNGSANIQRLLVYLDTTYFGGHRSIEPPEDVPDTGFYLSDHPDKPAADVAALKATGHWKADAPIIALLIQQSFWITRDLKVVDAEAAALRSRGFNVAVAFAQTAAQMESLLRDLHPDILAEDRHGSLWADPHDGKTMLQELDVPYLRPVSMLAYTVDEWMSDVRGLHPRDVGSFVAIQESKGTIEPIVVGGLEAGLSGYRLHTPIADRVEHFADRAWSWVNLRRTPNDRKRIAFIYYNKTLGQDDLMRGTPTGGFLDGPESFMRFLPALRKRGYKIENAPTGAAELIDRIRKQGRNIGPWAQGDVETLADLDSTVLIPLDQYLGWFNSRLSAANRAAVIKAHGEPPGRLMVVQRNGQSQIVIPALRLGNLILTPQPERGEAQDEKLLHSRDVPPPHNYLAFYWWLQEGFKADAIVHWGTHGSLELLPGKSAGLSRDDWGDICAGNMPVINLWIMDNLGEATISRRRSYALLVDHMVPLSVRPGLDAEATRLHEDIEKFDSLGVGALREEFRRNITTAARAQRLDQTLKLVAATQPSSGNGTGAMLTDEQITAVHDHLHVLLESRTPTSLHVLGENPPPKLLGDYISAILRKAFHDRVAELIPDAPAGDPAERGEQINALAMQIINDSVLHTQPPPPSLEKDIEFARQVLGRLNQCGDEITNLARALEGRYIAPGPGPDPIRNPSAVPSGRNLYALNPEEIPTAASWAVAVKLVDDMLKTETVRKVGFDLSGSSTMADFGVTEAQILYLMGVRPVWDQNNLAIDVSIIPASELKRPRVDVFVALGGSYKENFPSRVKLIDKAIKLVAALDEEDNGVRRGAAQLESELFKKGFSADRAAALSTARIFGTKNGAFGGTNILYLTPRSGAWESDQEIANVYIDHMSYVYSGEIWGEKIDGLYEQAIQGTDTLVRTWSSNLTSNLSNHHAYEYLGGMSLAVTKLTGQEPLALIADARDPDGARIRDFSEVLDTDFRTQLLNPAWIKGMQEHGYAGAGQIAELVKNTFGWQVTRRSSVGDGTWNEVYATYIQDKNHLGLDEWFAKANPHARQELAATMLEAARKGYWKASEQQMGVVSALYAESVAKDGPSDGLTAGGNKPLEQFVSAHLNAPGKQVLAAAFTAAMTRAAQPPAVAPGRTQVVGQLLQPAARAAASAGPAPVMSQGRSRGTVWATIAFFVALLVFVLGILRRTGSVG